MNPSTNEPSRTKVYLNNMRQCTGFSEVSNESVLRAVKRDESSTILAVCEHVHDRLSVH